MAFLSRLSSIFLGLALAFMLTACGIGKYPGQPGMVTNGYSKIDLENLDMDGLYVYEVSYDNSKEGLGVGAVVTKLHPGAQTYTTNVRTNADGTLYRAKGTYKGAVVQMISIPQQNQIILPADSKIAMFVDYELSLDEVDDKNLAEESLFEASVRAGKQGLRRLQQRVDWVLAAKITERGLSYDVKTMEFSDLKYEPATPIRLETNFYQNGVRTQISREERTRLAEFIEANFPKGYKGSVKFHFNGKSDPISLPVGVHTIKTAKAAGINVVENADETFISEVLSRHSNKEAK